jgi:SSS family solute:Na+ symporter
MFSIVATETSVLTFVSVPGLAYRGDWFFLQIALGYILGRILVSIFLLPKYFESGIVSIYQVVGQRFGPGFQKAASGTFLITRILADGVRFLATGVVIQVVTGWPLWAAVCIIGGVTLLYTLLGGIRIIVWVDSFQFVLYLLGALVSIIFLVHYIQPDIGEAFRQIVSAGKTRIFHFHGPVFFATEFAPGAILGGMFLSFASHGVDHMMVQRVLACHNLKSARRAMIGSGIFVFIQFLIFLLVGSLIYIYFNGAAMEKDREFAFFIVNDLPPGMKGLLLAGVLSAAMSTLSSSINSLASSFTTDWLKNPATLRISQAVSFAFAVILTFVALFFDESDKTIIEVGLEIASFTYGALLGLFLLARTTKKFSAVSLALGFAGSLLTVFALKSEEVTWTWFVAAGTAVSLLLSFGTEKLLRPGSVR